MHTLLIRRNCLLTVTAMRGHLSFRLNERSVTEPVVRLRLRCNRTYFIFDPQQLCVCVCVCVCAPLHDHTTQGATYSSFPEQTSEKFHAKYCLFGKQRSTGQKCSGLFQILALSGGCSRFMYHLEFPDSLYK